MAQRKISNIEAEIVRLDLGRCLPKKGITTTIYEKSPLVSRTIMHY